MKSLILFGGSHLSALFRAVREYPDATAIRDVQIKFCFVSELLFRNPFHTMKGGTIEFTSPPIAEMWSKTASRKNIVADPDVTLGLCLGTHSARMYRDPTWHKYAPASLTIPDRQPVSHECVEAIIDEDRRHVLSFMKDLSTAGVNWFALSAPPARKSHPSVKDETAAKIVSHLDSQYREGDASFCGEARSSFPPASSRNADEGRGLARPELLP